MIPHLAWQKSSFSGGGNGGDCVEVATAADAVFLRESDTPQAVVATSRAHVRVLLEGVKAGLFDRLTGEDLSDVRA